MNPRRQESRSALKAHQEAQRALRSSAATLTLREATETMVRQQSDASVAASQPGTPAGGTADVHDLTQRLMAKVDAAKRTRVDAIMRRHGAAVASSAAASTAGKKTAPPTSVGSRLGPIRLDIRVPAADADGDDSDADDELCILPVGGAPSMVRKLDPAALEHSQATVTQRGVGPTTPSSSPSASRHPDDAEAADAERDRQLLDNIRRRHEMRRLQAATSKLPSDGTSLLGPCKERSLSPTDSLRSFPPPPSDAPMLPSPGASSGGGVPANAFPRSPLLSAPPAQLNSAASLSLSVGLQRHRTADFTSRISAVCKEGDAEKIARLNSFDNATSRSAGPFGGSKA